MPDRKWIVRPAALFEMLHLPFLHACTFEIQLSSATSADHYMIEARLWSALTTGVVRS
jgi:hypothetical protein